MTRFVPLSSAAALMLALAGCGAEPAQESAATPEQSEVPAGEAPTLVETMPAAEAAATAADPAEATAVTRPPVKSRTTQEPKVDVPPLAYATREADGKHLVEGRSGCVRVHRGGSRILKK